MAKDEGKITTEIIINEGIQRRDFLKGAAFGMMGMMPLAALVGCSNNTGSTADTAGTAEAADSAGASASDGAIFSGHALDSDELMEAVLTESEVTNDLTLADGTVIPAIYLRMRNRINRIGRGVGSTPVENSWDMIKYLWSEEDAEHYLEMPLHEYFTASDYAGVSGRSEEECAAILEDQADRCLIWRVRRGGLPTYILMPYINGFWEFNELKALYSGVAGAVAEFDTQGISGSDPNGASGFDTTFPLFRSYPVSVDVVEGDELEPYQDWRALIRRNTTITVSACQCRTMWDALGVEFPEEHPHRTCLSLGEMAEYFIETGIGEQITQDEAIAIVEDIIDRGMVVESICAKNADIICCCHSKSCGNLMAYRGVNGEGEASTYYSAYTLAYDSDVCTACGKCIERCPMDSITFGDKGTCVMDNACVRCGQCVTACAYGARILKPTEGYPELPGDYVECNKFFAKERLQRGQLVDFTASSL